MTTTNATARPLDLDPAPGEPGWVPNPPAVPAHVIRDDAEAIAVAERLKPVLFGFA